MSEEPTPREIADQVAEEMMKGLRMAALGRDETSDDGDGIESVTLSHNGESVTLTGKQFSDAAAATTRQTDPYGSDRRLPGLEKAMAKAMVEKLTGKGPNDEYPAPIGYFAARNRKGNIETLDFLPAPDLMVIGDRLIRECEEFKHLVDEPITYLWKRQGGAHQGNQNLGRCTKASGLAAFYAESTWILWLAADTVRLYSLTCHQVEAAIYHELLHAGEEIDEDGNKKPAVFGHDWEGFAAEIRRYGDWNASLKLVKDAWQLPLFGPEGETTRHGAD